MSNNSHNKDETYTTNGSTFYIKISDQVITEESLKQISDEDNDDYQVITSVPSHSFNTTFEEDILVDSESENHYHLVRRHGSFPRKSLSNIQRFKRSNGKNKKNGIDLRESLVTLREGVPGNYSGFKILRGSRRALSVPNLVIDDSGDVESPSRPPRKNKTKKSSLKRSKISKWHCSRKSNILIIMFYWKCSFIWNCI